MAPPERNVLAEVAAELPGVVVGAEGAAGDFGEDGVVRAARRDDEAVARVVEPGEAEGDAPVGVVEVGVGEGRVRVVEERVGALEDVVDCDVLGADVESGRLPRSEMAQLHQMQQSDCANNRHRNCILYFKGW